MSALFPHADYAEDQRLAKTILSSHVIYRGFQTGAVLGLLVGDVRAFVLPLVRRTSSLGTVFSGAGFRAALPLLQRSTGVGALVGTALIIPGLELRMWGREDIEWKDRAWRLLANKGQVEVDNWSLAGEALGIAGVVAGSSLKGVSAWTATKMVAGGAGLGNIAGIVGYMVWRHGIHGGKFE